MRGILAGMDDLDKRRPKAKPEPISGAIDRLLRGQPGGRRARALAGLRRDWGDIAGPDFAEQAWPDRLEPGRGSRPGALVVLAAPGAALLLQYEAPRLLERVNGYLGEGAVGRIKVAPGMPPAKAAARPSLRRAEPDADDPALAEIANRAAKLPSARLATALQGLGAAIRARKRR